MTSQRLCFSLHIAINPSLSSFFFDFADTLTLRNIKNLTSLVFLLCNISAFDVFFKKGVQISHVSVKLVTTIEKKWMKVEQVQLF